METGSAVLLRRGKCDAAGDADTSGCWVVGKASERERFIEFPLCRFFPSFLGMSRKYHRKKITNRSRNILNPASKLDIHMIYEPIKSQRPGPSHADSRGGEKENDQTTRVLHHLREVERRKVWADWGHGDLREYCIAELGYTDQAARRRIDAMNLLRAMPKLEEQIISGELSLSVAAQAESFFRQESQAGKPVEAERGDPGRAEGKSARRGSGDEGPGVPAPEVREGFKPSTRRIQEALFVASDQLVDKIERIRGLLSNSGRVASLWVRLSRRWRTSYSRFWIPPSRQRVPDRRSRRRIRRRQSPRLLRRRPSPGCSDVVEKNMRGSANGKPASHTGESSDVEQSAPITRVASSAPSTAVTNPAAPGRREDREALAARHRLQVDHIILFAHGGPTTLENCRLLRHAHNRRYAIRSSASIRSKSSAPAAQRRARVQALRRTSTERAVRNGGHAGCRSKHQRGQADEKPRVSRVVVVSLKMDCDAGRACCTEQAEPKMPPMPTLIFEVG